MLTTIKQTLWKNFGASIDMLQNAILVWPEEYWHTDKKFFYNAYHCMLFLDYYLSIPPDNFLCPLPYTIINGDDVPAEAVDDVVPDKIYSKAELLNYLQQSRDKCKQVIASLTEKKLTAKWIEQPDELSASITMNYTVLEILFYNMRHVQHHAAQLNLLLRQKINYAPQWVSLAADEL